jgi:hypothetical protein
MNRHECRALSLKYLILISFVGHIEGVFATTAPEERLEYVDRLQTPPSAPPGEEAGPGFVTAPFVPLSSDWTYGWVPSLVGPVESGDTAVAPGKGDATLEPTLPQCQIVVRPERVRPYETVVYRVRPSHRTDRPTAAVLPGPDFRWVTERGPNVLRFEAGYRGWERGENSATAVGTDEVAFLRSYRVEQPELKATQDLRALWKHPGKLVERFQVVGARGIEQCETSVPLATSPEMPTVLSQYLR